MKIGILFGGPSREREIAFAGGRTVYDNLDKSLFTPVPIFIDSNKNCIRLKWEYIYKGSIRDFYPPVKFHPESPNHFQIYVESLGNLTEKQQEELIEEVGEPVEWEELPRLIDFAFLALHGQFGEDGIIQSLLENLEIPYSGSGVLSSALGFSKAVQKRLMKAAQWPRPSHFTIRKVDWDPAQAAAYFERVKEEIGFPYVVRPSTQGSSIGVYIEKEQDPEIFAKAVENAFFRQKLTRKTWEQLDDEQQVSKVVELTDIRSGLGLPLLINGSQIHHPEEVLDQLRELFNQGNDYVQLEAVDGESEVVVESFIEGKEFSCIVIRNESEEKHLANDRPVALPPTEIRKGGEVFDYRSKYLAGLSRKVTPIDLPDEQINRIREACEQLYDFFGFNVYARIDGFIKEDGTVYLNDPNTTSGMLPSSFFFHQAAEIGLNPSQFITYIIRTSIAERLATGVHFKGQRSLLKHLDDNIWETKKAGADKQRVAVILGGYSSERHISVESGRNIYEKLASSDQYEPIPVFLKGDDAQYELHQIPINLLLKDNADDICDKIDKHQQHNVVESIKETAERITAKYASADYQFEPQQLTVEELANQVDFAFIALHGRPGEDGRLQQELQQYNVPYNGSGPDSSALTINKYKTKELLESHGFKVAGQWLLQEAEWQNDPNAVLQELEKKFGYPFIAKPVDDGCSSAVKKINNEKQFRAFAEAMFRNTEQIGDTQAQVLKLKPREEFPIKQQMLIEELVTAEGAEVFMEITGGMLIDSREDGDARFEMFEPSEVLAGEEVLSLEEKFLAGQGQNITPARFGKDEESYQAIARKVKADLQKAADILDVEGYCRIDAFVRIYQNGKVETIIIEINSLPGMTPATAIFHQAAINGYKPFEFIDRIIQLGIRRNKRNFANA